MYHHTPVLLSEVLEYLAAQPGEKIIDATLGGGGYAFAIAERVGPSGTVVALDMDELALDNAKLKAAASASALRLNHANFADIATIAEKEFGPHPDADGVVFDLGLSSAQLEDRRRGFSFQADARLNMAFGSLVPDNKTEKIVNRTPVSELARLIREYGEERFALPIAKSIDRVRRVKPITTTFELIDAIRQALPPSARHGSAIHFATRTFQALRIATNDELGNLERALGSLRRIMKPGGRIVIVSFHSLEDRIVKQFFRTESKECICPPNLPACRCGHRAWLTVLTKKAITGSDEEIEANPRARSAKLRAARVLTTQD